MDNKLSELSKPVAWEVKGILCHSEEEAAIYVGEPDPLYSQEYVSAMLAELEASKCNASYCKSAFEEQRGQADCLESQLLAANKRIAELEAKLKEYEHG